MSDIGKWRLSSALMLLLCFGCGHSAKPPIAGKSPGKASPKAGVAVNSTVPSDPGGGGGGGGGGSTGTKEQPGGPNWGSGSKGPQPSPGQDPGNTGSERPRPNEVRAPLIQPGLMKLPGYSQSLEKQNTVANDPESPVRGMKIYRGYCQPCHGPTLDGTGLMVALKGKVPPEQLKLMPLPRDLRMPKTYKLGCTDQAIYRTVMYGIPRSAMGSYEKIVPDDKIWDVINYIKTKWLPGK